LEKNIELADRIGQPSLKAEACCDLGTIYNAKNQYKKVSSEEVVYCDFLFLTGRSIF
jgi:hypothetical protein